MKENFTMEQMARKNEDYYYDLLEQQDWLTATSSTLDMKPLLDILAQFRRAHLLVVGDLMLDRFIWGDVERISPEAPVPVMRVMAESHRLGGAANVINNVLSLGAQVTACGVIGRDMAGRRLVHDLRRAGASTAGIVADKQVQTTQKSRIIARPRHQQIVRLDRENQNPIADATLKRLREFVLARAKTCDGIVISDYGKGVVHGEPLEVDCAFGQAKKAYLCGRSEKGKLRGLSVSDFDHAEQR